MFRRAGVVAVLVGGLLATTPSPPAHGEEAADVHMLGTDREAGGEPFGYVGTGLPGGFQFFDGDAPQTLRRIAVRISSTSDPDGVLAWASRNSFNDAYYKGAFRFSTAESDPVGSVIKVADGDEVTMTYLDPNGDDGLPVEVTASAPWHAGSARPDVRELSFSDADPAAPVVRGAWRAVAPGAAVRVYDAVDAATPLAVGTAEGDGSFEVTTLAFDERPDVLWVAAVESGQAESVRVMVSWAAVTGRVVRPDDGGGVLYAFAYVLPPGCASVDDDCALGSSLTNHAGRFDALPSQQQPPEPGEGYSLQVRRQETGNPGMPPPWPSTAYGSPPLTPFDYPGPNSVDLGDVEMLGPNFGGRVRAGLVAVDEASITVKTDAGDWAADPGGNGIGGYTRHDGRFALHLPDGDYVVTIAAPPGCSNGAPAQVEVSVEDGVATPSSVEIDAAGGAVGPATQTVPVAGDGVAPVGIDVLSPAGPVSVTLPGAEGDGSLALGCGVVDLPGVTEVALPVEIDASGLSFGASEVCLGYDPEALAAQGFSAADVELYHVGAGGAGEVITTERDLGARRICGTTTSFSPFVLGVPTGNGGFLPATDPPPGYWMLGQGGTVYPFGSAGSLGGVAAEVVDIESNGNGDGYWILGASGAVHARGTAAWHGNVSGLQPGERVTSLSGTPIGDGYWVFTSLGRALNFGAAPHFGDMAGKPLNGPVLDSVATPLGQGYYMVASDGGVFAFGDAAYHGSMGGKPLNRPVESLVPTTNNSGYWLVASDGGVFAFDAPFRGSMGSTPLNQPVTGMVAYGDGYLMVATDGGIFNFSDGPFLGSLGGSPPARPIVAVASAY